MASGILRAAPRAQCASLIEAGVADGSIRECDPRITAFALAGALNWTGHWYRDDGHPQAARDRRPFSSMISTAPSADTIEGEFRLGPAEVESVLVEHPAVSEAAAIGVPDKTKGQALVCFCVLKLGAVASDDLSTELMTLVATPLGKPLRPKAIEFVTDLPKTRNAKIMRRVIRSAYLGEASGDLSSLENPSSPTGTFRRRCCPAASRSAYLSQQFFRCFLSC